MTSERVFVVDRVEEGVTVMRSEDGEEWTISVHDLPLTVHEGMVVHVPVGQGGPRWSLASADSAEEVRRREEAEARLRRLRRRDPGGDLEL